MSNSFGNEVSNGTCTRLSRQALLFAMFFFKDQGKKYGRVFQPDTAPVFKSLQHYIGKLKLTVLLVLTTEQTFNMVHLHCDFLFPQKAFVKSCCYRRPKKYFLL